LGLALDSAYAQELVRLLRDGPGLISPRDAKGLIGFPSYHAAMALLVIWYLRDVRILRWPVVALNLAVLMATPVQGGHHVIDVLAAFPVAALSIFVTARMARAAKIAKMVNKPSKSAEPVPVAAG
jgi:membrane-associated phospholipid phosphatase